VGEIRQVEETYSVTAKRGELDWELHIEGVGVTQSATLASTGRMARSFQDRLRSRPDSHSAPNGSRQGVKNCNSAPNGTRPGARSAIRLRMAADRGSRSHIASKMLR